MNRLRVEILTFSGCPNAEITRRRVRRALDLEGRAADIIDVLVETHDAAQELRFLGSPSVRVNGKDIEPDAESRVDYALMCRTYRDESRIVGFPPLPVIRNAIRSVADSSLSGRIP